MTVWRWSVSDGYRSCVVYLASASGLVQYCRITVADGLGGNSTVRDELIGQSNLGNVYLFKAKLSSQNFQILKSAFIK